MSDEGEVAVVSIVNVGTRTGGFVKEADELAKALQLVGQSLLLKWLYV